MDDVYGFNESNMNERTVHTRQACLARSGRMDGCIAQGYRSVNGLC